MSELRLKNIFITQDGGLIPYTSRQSGGQRATYPPRQREEHGAYIYRRLREAWQESRSINTERTAISLPTKEGTYIEFLSSPDYELELSSLERRRSGIRLLNVQAIEQDGLPVKKATVFIPEGQEQHYLQKVEEYLQSDTPSGRPKNEKLIASIENIKIAVLESFWVGDHRYMPEDSPQWCEVWLSSDSEDVEERFRSMVLTTGLSMQPESLRFPERTVVLVYANSTNLKEIILRSPDIAEIRRAAELASFFTTLDNSEQVAWAKDLMERLDVIADSSVSICILDTGVNNGHILLNPLLKDEDKRSYNREWGSNDHNGHGTNMAGIAGYGDLQDALETRGRVKVFHNLESYKILPPPPGENEPKLYGAITSQSISDITIDKPNIKRILCMAVTAPDYETTDGKPSSWSAAIDEITSGYLDEERKLFIVSAGNVSDPTLWREYPTSNLNMPVQNPAQSWNSLTVGAFTEKVSINKVENGDFEALAPRGGLSPTSSTSYFWDNKWPIKPEILLEGGNILNDPSDLRSCDDLSQLTTSHRVLMRQFDYMNATSAATAKAAWMAAQIQVEYPDAWPETIRALMVHSAEWTETLKDQFLRGNSKRDYRNMLRICGYGVPNLERAIWCAKNSVNMIIQSDLQPFEKNGSRYVTKDMHFHELPWPKDQLLELGNTEVELKVTLSYFIEPGPGEVGWKNRYRYPSCGLRFEINGSDTKETFLRRINAAAETDEDEIEIEGTTVNWLIGKQNRHLGSIHSDVWTGTAAELATSNLIGIYPAVGWWRERHWLGRWNKRVRYSLVVSLKTPEQSIDLYSVISNKIETTVSV
ncbi:S8 family peptidase [Paenibacillus lupini]